jgi:hypothetical protein
VAPLVPVAAQAPFSRQSGLVNAVIAIGGIAVTAGAISRFADDRRQQ